VVASKLAVTAADEQSLLVASTMVAARSRRSRAVLLVAPNENCGR
jgi:hypothetical protein